MSEQGPKWFVDPSMAGLPGTTIIPRDQSLDYSATYGSNVDPDTGASLAHSYRMPATATEEDLYERAALVYRVNWRLIYLRNRRTWMRDFGIKLKRKQVLKDMKARNEKVREQDFQQEDVNINTRLAKYEAEIRVDAEMAGEDPDAVMTQLRAEVLAEMPVDAPEQ